MAIRGPETKWLERPGGEEAEAMRTALSRAQAEAVMIADCGHYPHAQRPEPTAAAMLAFMQRIGHVAGGENGTRAEP